MSIFFAKTGIGYSHIVAEKQCQDFSACYNDEERTIVTVCDGHGSNVYFRSHLGAKFASCAAIDVLREVERSAFYKSKKEAVLENIRLNILCRWNALVEAHLEKHPYRASEMLGLSEAEILSVRKNPFKAYGTTLHAAMILATRIVCVSLGDGGCFLVKGGVTVPAFAEDEDEPVANITYSLCQDDAFSHLSVSVHELNAYDGAVVCTDGLINPYQNLQNFSTALVTPAIATLCAGRTKALETCVTELGARLGTGDDASLGIVVKDKLSTRAYKYTQII